MEVYIESANCYVKLVKLFHLGLKKIDGLKL